MANWPDQKLPSMNVDIFPLEKISGFSELVPSRRLVASATGGGTPALLAHVFHRI